MRAIDTLYHRLYARYGPQGWWPLLEWQGENPAKTGSIRGYHPLNYDLPATRSQIYEICAGAILTQSVSWKSVEKALHGLQSLDALQPERLLSLSTEALALAIRPAGYFNQKAKKLRLFSEFFVGLSGRIPSREELLAIWGIGKETADSMLLYAFKVPTFVVDTYTRRLLVQLGLIDGGEEYDRIKAMFEDSLPCDLVIFQEFHALIVEHAKRLRSQKDAGL